MGAITVALLGSRGNLGSKILLALLHGRHRYTFKAIIAVGQDDLPPSLLNSANEISNSSGIPLTIEKASYADRISISKSLSGVDLVVNATNFPVNDPNSETYKDNILQAVSQNRVKVYIPSEYGVDWRFNDFAQADWDAKRAHQAKARGLSIKVVGVYVGLVTERAFGKWFGFDFGSYTLFPIGDPTVKTSYTSLEDIGQAIAQLASIAANKGSHNLPDHLRISGEALSYNEVKKLFEESDPQHKRIDISPVNLENYESDLGTGRMPNTYHGPAAWIRLVAGKGNLDHSKSCEDGDTKYNDFINDGSLWQWQTVQSYAEAVNGRPFME